LPNGLYIQNVTHMGETISAYKIVVVRAWDIFV
jgi:hypothetical protein